MKLSPGSDKNNGKKCLPLPLMQQGAPGTSLFWCAWSHQQGVGNGQQEFFKLFDITFLLHRRRFVRRSHAVNSNALPYDNYSEFSILLGDHKLMS